MPLWRVSANRMKTRALTAAALSAFFVSAVPAQAVSIPHPLWLGVEEIWAVGAGGGTPSPGTAGVPFEISRKISQTGSRYQRVSASWRELQPDDKFPSGPPSPTSWTDANFDQTAISQLDDAVRAAADTRPATGFGLQVLLQVESAPYWAEDLTGRPEIGPFADEQNNYKGAWQPRSDAVKALAQALATRYDGNDRHNTYGRLLPKITAFQAWNEPNLSTHLAPQTGPGGTLVGPRMYRELLNAFDQGLHDSGRTDTQTVAAGMSPFGQPRGVVQGTSPQIFAQGVLCVQKVGRAFTKVPDCGPVHFDIWAQHPYDIQGLPMRPADPKGKNGLMADIPALRAAVAAGVREGTVLPAVTKRFWVTEFDWWTNPPSLQFGKSPGLAGRFTMDSLWRAWAAGVDTLFWYGMRDIASWSGGLWNASAYPATRVGLTTQILAADKAKPSLRAFQWPFREVKGARPYAWGIVPCRLAGQRILIDQVIKRRWRPVTHGNSFESGVFQIPLSARGKGVGRWRARAPVTCGGTSPEWNSAW